MSKSVEDPAGTVMLSDPPELAAKKVMEATTDSLGVINYDWEKQPGVTNLLEMLALLSNKSQPEIVGEWQGKTSYNQLKKTVADMLGDFLFNLQNKLAKVDEEHLINKLEKDEDTVSADARKTLLKVQKAVGLRE
jgi:tryptophanyl-tRNA synthetase